MHAVIIGKMGRQAGARQRICPKALLRTDMIHRYTTNFLKIKVYNIDIINLSLNGTCVILLLERWCEFLCRKKICEREISI